MGVAPSAYAASLWVRGTARMASSERKATVGTPASTPRRALRTERSRVPEYSPRKMAVRRPQGRATRPAPTATRTDPERRGRIPKCFSRKRGVHSVSVRNSSTETCMKKRTVSDRRTRTIPTVTRAEIPAHSASAPTMKRSPRRRTRPLERRGPGAERADRRNRPPPCLPGSGESRGSRSSGPGPSRRCPAPAGRTPLAERGRPPAPDATLFAAPRPGPPPTPGS